MQHFHFPHNVTNIIINTGGQKQYFAVCQDNNFNSSRIAKKIFGAHTNA